MKKYILSFLCAAVIAASSSAVCSFADETEPVTKANTQSEVTISSETAQTTAANGRDDSDPLSQADEKEIPLSFYIGGGVMVVFVLASVVVLIIGKSKKNN